MPVHNIVVMPIARLFLQTWRLDSSYPGRVDIHPTNGIDGQHVVIVVIVLLPNQHVHVPVDGVAIYPVAFVGRRLRAGWRSFRLALVTMAMTVVDLAQQRLEGVGIGMVVRRREGAERVVGWIVMVRRWLADYLGVYGLVVVGQAHVGRLIVVVMMMMMMMVVVMTIMMVCRMQCVSM